MQNNQTTAFDTSFLLLLFLVFLVLKLTSVITWSWWWVTAPLWGPFALLIAIGILGFLWFGVKSFFE